MSDRAERAIPVQRPVLPQADRLLPYLARDRRAAHVFQYPLDNSADAAEAVWTQESLDSSQVEYWYWYWYVNGLLSRAYFAILKTTLLQPGNAKSLSP